MIARFFKYCTFNTVYAFLVSLVVLRELFLHFLIFTILCFILAVTYFDRIIANTHPLFANAQDKRPKTVLQATQSEPITLEPNRQIASNHKVHCFQPENAVPQIPQVLPEPYSALKKFIVAFQPPVMYTSHVLWDETEETMLYCLLHIQHNIREINESSQRKNIIAMHVLGP